MKKILFLLLALPVFCYAQTDSVLVLSDVHVDRNDTVSAFYHVDSSPALFLSAIENAKAGKYPFIIMPGDLLKHGKVHTKKEMKESFEFVIKHVQSIDRQAIVLPAIGNNDCMAHNTPDEATYEIFYKALLKKIDHGRRIKRSFLKGGYYAYEKDGLSVIVLNTVLFMPENAQLVSEAKEELTWLEEKLKALRPDQSAWLVYHVPPGIDRYGKTPSWQDSLQAAYLRIVKQYAPRIKFQLAGHTHMVDTRLLADSGKLTNYVAIAPGLDSRNGNNPAYQVVHYSKKDKIVSEITTHYTDATSEYKWHSFTFTDVDFGFFLNATDSSNKGADFIKHYTANRGATSSSDKMPIIWNDEFRAISTIKLP